MSYELYFAAFQRVGSVEDFPLEKVFKNKSSQAVSLTYNRYTAYTNWLAACHSALNGDKGQIFSRVSSHTCREALLHTMSEIQHAISQNSSYSGSTFMVELRNLDEIGQEVIRRFSEKFLTRNGWISVKENAGATYVVFRADEANNFMPSMYRLSFVLYLFRNTGLLEDCLENVKVGNFHNLCGYLYNAFLEHPEWGDGANPAVMLSLFAFAVTVGDNFGGGNYYVNGPVNAAGKLVSAPTVIRYVKEVFVKKYNWTKVINYVGPTSGFNRTLMYEFSKLLIGPKE